MARPTFTFVRVVALILRDGAVLLEPPWQTERGSQPLWNAPGGALEPGESVEEGLRREVREETGMEVDLLGIAYVTQRLCAPEEAGAGRPLAELEICCYARPAAGSPPPRPEYPFMDAPRWVPLPEVADLPTLPFDLRGWARAAAGAGGAGLPCVPLTHVDWRERGQDSAALAAPFLRTWREGAALPLR